MSISGSLETFSLPELFRLIDSGSKSGRLIVIHNSSNAHSSSKRLYYIWFDRGRLTTISDRLNHQGLIEAIEARGWLSPSITGKLWKLCPAEVPLGIYLESMRLLKSEQISLLFQMQLHRVYRLFESKSSWFRFDELARDGEINSLKTLPWLEMTGQSIRATQANMYALRLKSTWEIFKEHLPEPNYALEKLAEQPYLRLMPLESHIWQLANGSIPLKKIAIHINQSVRQVQLVAFRLIMVGLVEEVCLSSLNSAIMVNSLPESSYQSKQTTIGAIASEKKPSQPIVSKSLLSNLMAFLRRKLSWKP